MLEIFRRNLFINSLLLLPYIFIVRIGTLINPVSVKLPQDSNILQELIFNNITHPLAQSIFANLLIFVQVVLINYIFNNHKLAREITLFAGLFYILFVSLIPENLPLSNALIANTFIILAVKNLFETYKNAQASAYIFNTGFMIGLASLYYYPYFTYLIFGIVSLLMIRSFKIIEKLQFFIGFVIPYFLVSTYRYWYDMPFADFKFIKSLLFQLPHFKSDGLIVTYISVAVLMLGVLFSIFNYGNLTAKKAIQSQKKIDIIYVFMLFCFISLIIFKADIYPHLLTLAFPLAVLTGINVSESKKIIFYEFLHLFLLGLIFISQFKLINF